jgi:hypothetical protein
MAHNTNNNTNNNIKYKLLSGGLSGIIEAFCTHPIDLVKIKLQESSQKKQNNK